MPSQIQKATVQASILNVTSSVLAQLLQAYRKSSFPPSSSASSLYGLQLLPILQFLFWCLLSTPPNFMWQEFLEKHFPGYPAQRDKQKIKVDDGGKGVTIEQKLDVKNTAAKLVLDQTVGALLNNAGFIISITAVRGGSWNDCTTALSTELWPLLIASYKLWPLVSLLNFLVVPVERRVVFGGVVGLFWGIYMVLRVTD